MDDDDTLTYYEFGGDGYALRQVDLQGSEQRPVTAATLEEVLHARDHGGFDAVVAYERKYGVITEGNLGGWRDVDQVVEISSAEFEQAPDTGFGPGGTGCRQPIPPDQPKH